MVNTPAKKLSLKKTGSHTRTAAPAPASKSHIFTKFVGNLEVKPQQQTRMSLGLFDAEHPAKGFSVGLSPDPATSDSVVTEVATLGSGRHYELILQIANYGTQKLQAEVWQI